jgi:6-phosphogluconolactonase
VRHEIRSFDDDDLAVAAADFVADCAQRSVAARGGFSFAVSGGRTPWKMFVELLRRDMPWSQTVIYQVDERIAPLGDPQRNLTSLIEILAGVAPRIEPMPVNDHDLDAAAALYGQSLPDRLDLVHLGLGRDGHTASLVPGDPVLEVDDRLVATTTSQYEGLRRMTLTYPALARGEQLLWIVAGSDKRHALELLLAGDTSIPASRVEATHSLILADRAAM